MKCIAKHKIIQFPFQLSVTGAPEMSFCSLILLLADLVEKQNDQDEDESTDNVNEKKHVTKLQC